MVSLQIFQASLGMQRERFLDMTKYSKHLEAYETFLTKMLLLIGAEKNKAEMLVKDVVEFEIKLANVRNSYFQFVKKIVPDIFIIIIIDLHIFLSLPNKCSYNKNYNLAFYYELCINSIIMNYL